MKKEKAHVITLSGDDVLQNRKGFSKLLDALPENVHVLVITNTKRSDLFSYW